MRKLICLLAFALAMNCSLLAQKTETVSKEAVANEEFKALLVSKMQFSNTVADRIVVIEEEFHAGLAALNALGDIPVKDREVKLNAIHVTRRSKLIAAPMTPRQMEDVVDLVETIRRKNKL